MTHIEKNWLDYAWHVVGDSECCSAASKWPGYLGARYEDGRVLIVGAVHNAEALFTPEIKKLAAIACDWRRGAVSDERYLSTVRWAYEHSRTTWEQNTVWRNLRTLREKLGIDFDQTAFTNLAKCYLQPRKSTDALFMQCNNHFPLNDLIRRLEPLAVFIAKSSEKSRKVFDQYRGRSLIYQYHNLNGLNERDEKLDQWAKRAAEEYQRLRPDRHRIEPDE
jgi:hypothetical protein